MECPSCHKKNIQGEDFCVYCGYDLYELDEPTDRMGKSLLDESIRNLERHAPIEAGPDETVAAAVRKMVEHRHGEVVIMENGRIAGIFTERDLTARVLDHKLDLAKTKLGDVMTRHVETVTESDPVAVALHKMALIGCRHMPISSDSGCAGVISVSSILSFFARQIPSGVDES